MPQIAGYRLPALIGATIAVVLAAEGCRTSKVNVPVTHPVKGKVRFKEGGPLKGVTIQFEAMARSSLTIRGDIKKDGTFSLSTLLANGTTVPGAIEGTHKVIVIPPMTADQNLEPIKVLTSTCTVKPGENVFTIEIEIVRSKL